MRTKTQWHTIVVRHRPMEAAACVMAALTFGCCLAHDDDLQMRLGKGADLLAQGENNGALREFEEAARTAPKDSEVLFFEGVALNRLGRFADAAERLKNAKRLGCSNADLEFEQGWSFVGQGKWREALPLLQSYEAKHPGRGQTSEFMARAHAAMGDVVTATHLLDEAVARDPELRPTVRSAREVMSDPDSRTATPFDREKISPVALHGGLLLGVGYNTNILGLSDDFQRLPGFPGLESAFVQTAADVSLDWQVDAKTAVTLKGGLQWVAYDKTSVANLLDVTAGADVRHQISDDLMGRVQVDFEHSELGGDPFRTAWQLRPSLTWKLCEWTATELGGAFAMADYSFPLPSSLDRDALSYAVDLTQHFSLVQGRLRALVGGFARWDAADGEEFDGHSIGLRTGIAAMLPGRIDAEVMYVLAADHFDNASMLSLDEERRHGTAHAVSAQFCRPLGRGISVYLRYSYQIADSNVSFYEYDQHLWMAGVRVRL